MARAHVLENSGGRSRIVFHITVAAGNNSAGISWVTAIKNGLAPTSRLPDGDGTGGTVSAAERTDIANGVVLEIEDSAFIPPGMNAAQANAFLDALHAAKAAEINDQVPKRLQYFGYVRT